MQSVPDYSLIAEDTCNIPNYFNLENIFNYFFEDSLVGPRWRSISESACRSKEGREADLIEVL